MRGKDKGMRHLMLLSPDHGCNSEIQIYQSYPTISESMNVLSINIFF